MKISDNAYSTYILLKRFTVLMNDLNDASDDNILKTITELKTYLEKKGA